jgi:hypothetical protein
MVAMYRLCLNLGTGGAADRRGVGVGLVQPAVLGEA